MLLSTGLGWITGHTMDIENNVKVVATIGSYPSTGSFYTNMYVSDHLAIHTQSHLSMRY